MKRRSWSRLRTVLLSSLVAGIVLPGCSGGASRGPAPVVGANRSLIFSVRWPDRSRLVPRAAESIVVRVQRDGQTVATRTVNRPADGGTTRVSLERLPVGALTATASAYPAADGQGVAQAAGTAKVTAEAGSPFTLTVTMDSTIASLDVSADRSSVFLGESLALTATAYDRDGNIVLVGDTVRWSSSGPEAAINGANGVLVGRRVGTATLTAEETESGVRKSVAVRVKGVERITVEPAVVRILDENDAVLTAVAYDTDGQVTSLTPDGWQWGITATSIARLFGGGSSVRVGGLSVGKTEISLQTVAGGQATVPVYVYPSHVSGTLSVTRSGYDGPGTVFVTGDAVSVTLTHGETVGGESLANFPVDDSRLVLVELDDFTDDFGDKDSVEFTLDVSGPDAPNGQPYFVFADSGGTSVSGKLTRSDPSQVFRLIVRDPISGDARSRKSRLRPETIPSRAERRRARRSG